MQGRRLVPGPAALLLLALAACAQPTTGALTPFPRSQRPPFPVAQERPDQVTGASGEVGSLDLVGYGAVTTVQGWTPSPDARLVVVTDQPVTVLDTYREVRPDAAAALSAPVPDLGFHLRLRAHDAVLTRLCVLTVEPDGSERVVHGSDPRWCRS
ncbi:MAG: hypothetical protein JWN17_1801 [Frankiales bacterium]|nr:hypothetical protein [Frankiales bacterium]